VFAACLHTVDWKQYRAWCVKDACANPASQSVCIMISALALSCAVRGVHVDWMSDQQLAGFCRGWHALHAGREMEKEEQGSERNVRRGR